MLGEQGRRLAPGSVPPRCFSDGPLRSSVGRNLSSGEFLLASFRVEPVGPVPPQASAFPGHRVVASARSCLSACAVGCWLYLSVVPHIDTCKCSGSCSRETHTQTHIQLCGWFYPSIQQVVFPSFTSPLAQSCRMTSEKERLGGGL